MRKRLAAIALVALAGSLAACGQRVPGPSNAVIERVLTGAPGAAQPSTIVATELAFARSARENGQWTAFEEFAAPGAMLHTSNGLRSYAELRPALTDPDEAVQWAPRSVVMSCDGGHAVSVGRFQSPEGIVGNFVTIWERQSDNTYRWVYDGGGPDVPQPPPRRILEGGDIVVTALNAVEGLVATCPRAGESVGTPPTDSPVALRPADVKQSRDGTLRWRVEHRGTEDGGTEKYVAAEYWFEGEWITAVEERLPNAS